MAKARAEGEVDCTWYPGFNEYYCECVAGSTYCDEPSNQYCIPDDYVSTPINLNGGRTFWNCKRVEGGCSEPPCNGV